VVFVARRLGRADFKVRLAPEWLFAVCFLFAGFAFKAALAGSAAVDVRFSRI
jgi:hypothetical protein